ncbi:MAG: class I SAM-dependent methyltransferase [Planctomycetaceae bacterium]
MYGHVVNRRPLWIRLLKRSNTLSKLHEVRKNQIRRAFVDQIIPKGGIGAELGVHKGYFTQLLLDVTRPQRLHLVDPWYLLSSEWVWAGGNQSTTDAVRGIIKCYAKQLVDGICVLNISDDLEFLTGLPDRYFDWVYVDTSHEYEHTQKELQILQHKVKFDGVISGDDWQTDPSHHHHGVCKAICEFLDASPFELIYGGDNDKQWAIRRKKSMT